MKTLDEILLEAIPPIQNCEPKNNAAKQMRARARQQILELFVPRDKTEPYKPDLEYKEIDINRGANANANKERYI